MIHITLFYNSKIYIPNSQLAYLEKITSIRGQSCLVQRSQAFKTPTRLLSNRFNNRDYTNLLKLNQPRLFEAFIRPKTFIGLTALAGPPQALFSIFQDPSTNQFS